MLNNVVVSSHGVRNKFHEGEFHVPILRILSELRGDGIITQGHNNK